MKALDNSQQTEHQPKNTPTTPTFLWSAVSHYRSGYLRTTLESLNFLSTFFPKTGNSINWCTVSGSGMVAWYPKSIQSGAAHHTPENRRTQSVLAAIKCV